MFVSAGTLLLNISSENFQVYVPLIHQLSSYPERPSTETAGTRLHARHFFSHWVGSCTTKISHQNSRIFFPIFDTMPKIIVSAKILQVKKLYQSILPFVQIRFVNDG